MRVKFVIYKIRIRKIMFLFIFFIYCILLALDAFCLLEVFSVLEKRALDIGLDWREIVQKSTHKRKSKGQKVNFEMLFNIKLKLIIDHHNN